MVIYLLGAFTLIVTTLTLASLFHFSYKKKHPYALWFLGGFLYNCFTVSFFYVFLPVPWIENITLQYAGITLFILLGAILAGASFLIIPLLLRKTYLIPLALVPLSISFAFLLQDIVRSTFISLLLYGKGAPSGIHFILGSIGESLAFTPLVIFSYWGSVYFLTALLSLLIFLGFTLIKKILPLRVIAVYLVLLVIIFFSLLVRRESTLASLTPHDPLKIGIVTTDSPNPTIENPLPEYKARTEKINTLLREKITSPFDIVILPESTSYLDTRDVLNMDERFPIKSFLDSTTIPKKEDYHVSTIFRDEEVNVTETRRKDGLMVFSEYNPYLYDLLLYFFKDGTERTRTLTRSTSDYHTFTAGDLRFGVLICSEGTSLMPLHNFEKKNPDFYVLQSNLAIMQGRSFGFMHLYAYTRLLATTSGKPVLGVSNSAPSYGFDGKGRPLYSINKSYSFYEIILP